MLTLNCENASMNVQVLKPDSFKRMSWRNGGGSTTELHAEEHDNYEGPVWRISMAEVTSDGPFSHFEDYDRTLTLVKGPGMTLHHAGGAEDVLGQRFAMATRSRISMCFHCVIIAVTR